MSIETSLVPYCSLETQVKEWALKRDKPEGVTAVALAQIQSADTNKYSEAFQSEVVFSKATDPHYIAASYGAGPCVIVGAYEPKHHVSFVAHFSHDKEVQSSGMPTLIHFRKLLEQDGAGSSQENKEVSIDLFIRGGILHDSISQSTFVAIADWMREIENTYPELRLNIKSLEILNSKEDASKSLAIDTRVGSVHDYDPLVDNPNFYRRLTVEDILWAKTSFESKHALKPVPVPGARSLPVPELGSVRVQEPATGPGEAISVPVPETAPGVRSVPVTLGKDKKIG